MGTFFPGQLNGLPQGGFPNPLAPSGGNFGGSPAAAGSLNAPAGGDAFTPSGIGLSPSAAGMPANIGQPGQQPIDPATGVFGMMTMIAGMMTLLMGMLQTLLPNLTQQNSPLGGTALGNGLNPQNLSAGSGPSNSGNNTSGSNRGSEAAGNLPPASNGTPGAGGFVNPVEGGDTVSVFGDPRDGGARSHKGVDIAADTGTPVRAVKGGTIERMRFDDMPGFYIVINHGDGTYSKYMHLMDFEADQIELRDGQAVEAGQVIGRVDKTGNARNSISHLHFEYHRGDNGNDSALDPRQVPGLMDVLPA